MKRSKQRPLKRLFLLLLLPPLPSLPGSATSLPESLHPFQGYAQNTVVQIDSGMSVAAIGKKLERQGVIASAEYFVRYYRLFLPAGN